MYGHKFNGNLRAYADYVVKSNANEGAYEIAYATLDPEYYKALRNDNPKVIILNMNNFRDMLRIGFSDVIITSHGLHTLALLLRFTNIKFINVWHGIGWKGHYPSEFTFTKKYFENWVSSGSFKKIYKKVFGIESFVRITGYARSDYAVNGQYNIDEIRKKYSISNSFKKIILVAPTWKQGDTGYDVYPFGLTSDDFFTVLNDAAKEVNSLVIFRSHLNTKTASLPKSLGNIVLMPYGEYPIVEDFLSMADVLISDWSSIVFDFLPFNRPTIFLDVPSPYDRLCMSEKYRYGKIVSSANGLESAIVNYVKNPESYKRECKDKIKSAIVVGYGDTLDGKSSERYHKRIIEILNET
jgi:CDP-glycerol glycerophosphotransferase